MKKTIFAAFVSLLIFTGGTNAFAVHKKLTNEDQKHLAITIYNNNIALVKDRRSVHLKKGINRLSFSDISAKIIPNSALIRRESPKPSFKVIEQAFRYEQLTPKSLLEASVGQEVFIDLGHEPIQSGRLVSVHGGILVSIKGKMREVKEHQLLFPQVPHELATNPEKLKAIKDKLKSNLSSAPLFDTPLFTKNIESAYTKMYERYHEGLEPDHIYVE